MLASRSPLCNHPDIALTDADLCTKCPGRAMNGILKSEYYLDLPFPSLTVAQRAVAQAVFLYNEERPHGALEMATPNQYHADAIAA